MEMTPFIFSSRGTVIFLPTYGNFDIALQILTVNGISPCASGALRSCFVALKLRPSSCPNVPQKKSTDPERSI